MPGTATTILIDGTPTDGSDPWIDSLVTGGAWKDSNGGTVTIQWTAFQGTMDGQNSYGWTSLALAGLREAMSLWESVANIDFVEVSGAANADVRFWWGTEAQAGGAGVLGWSDLVGFEDYYENPASETRDILFNAQDPAMSGALDDGGLGLVTMVHEIGHLLGLAHPHDGGAGSDATTFQGVNWWDPYNIGSGGLNQGVYTVMSYNFGWPSKVPDHTAESWGLTYGPMALDIAAIQEIYGANTTYASGDNVYVLPKTHGAGTYWTSIWDTGGIDTISAAGAPGVTTIDLRDPTDAYDGVNLVSFSYDVSGYIIEGGYTIARGVVIENAIGGNSNDRLYGNEVSNRLEGGNGADQLDGREGADTMIGGAGGDYYYVDDVGDLVIEFASGSNYDTVISTVDYTLREHVENLTLYPGYGPLNGRGNSSANVLTGTEDDNILEGAGGADTLDGKNGNDRLVVDGLSFAKVDGGEGIDTLALGGAGLVLDLTSLATQWKLWNLERIDLTGTGDNTLIVSPSAIYSSIGQSVSGRRVLVVERDSGDVVQFSGAGWTNTESYANVDGTFDRWVLGSSEVHLEQVVSPSGATIIGTAGNDVISTTVSVPGQPLATVWSDTIDGGPGADTMSGGGGDDIYVVDNAGDRTIENAEGGVDLVRSSINWTLGDNVEDLELLAGALAGTGNGLANRITGNSGDNTLDGGLGDDTMVGGLGNDTYFIDTNSDQVVEAADGGIDTVLSSIGWTLGANIEHLTLTGSNAISGFGNGLDNWLIGNEGVNTLVGGAGNDTYVVGLGDVVIEYGEQGTDTMRASVSFTLAANVENLVLTGSANVDGTGNWLVNVLTGNSGNNVLDGGAGADAMAGGLGDDIYVVDTAGDIVTEAGNQGTDTVNAWLGWTLGAHLEQLRLMGTADLNGTGNGLNNALFGTAGKNVLDGGAGTDAMAGGLGDDTYVVDNAGDVVTEIAGGGIDTVRASVSQVLAANVENLILTGTASVDGTGNGLSNTLTGNAEKNVLNGGAGADTMAGGAADDTYTVDNIGDVVIELANGGIDTVVSSISWTLGAALEKLTLTGTANFKGTGNELNNILTGNVGNNLLDGGIGADTMVGGAGIDTYVVDAAGDVVIEAENEGNDLVRASINYTLGNNVERLTLTGAAHLRGTGNALANVLQGNNGNNVLDGKAGADSMAGGLGDDTYIVDEIGDVAIEDAGAGTDTVQSSVTWRLRATFEKLILTGVADINATGNELTNVLTGNSGKNVLDGLVGADTMSGGLGDDIYIVDDAGDRVNEKASEGIDTMRSSVAYMLGANVENLILTGNAAINGKGNAENNVIIGNAADNFLDGRIGADTMEGGAGNDAYMVDNAGDLVLELAGGGADDVQSTISYSLTANVEKLTLLGTDSLNGTGNGLANNLIGNVGNNRLDGGAGADSMTGGLGDDTYVIDNSGDRANENPGAGTDTVLSSISHSLRSHVENLVLTGTAAINGIGNGEGNVLAGNAAANVLNGQAGADTMVGGDGDDTYVVENAGDVVVELAGGGTDIIQAWISYALVANVERLKLYGTADIDAAGNELANIVVGNTGHNILDGGLGVDTVNGGGGGDTFRFSTVLGANNVDRIQAFDHAIDTIQLDDSIFAGLGIGVLAAGAFNFGAVATQADDRILYNAANRSLSYDADGLGGVGAVKFATLDALTGTLDHTDFLIV